MSMMSPVAHQAGAGTAFVYPANQSTLAGWGLLIDGSLTILRNRLAAKLDEADRDGKDAERAKIEAALSECDAIQVSASALIVPYQTEYRSILGYLVADLEAAVSHAENAAKIAALQAHKMRLDELMAIGDTSST